jgi:hypothetical protein
LMKIRKGQGRRYGWNDWNPWNGRERTSPLD